MVESAENKGKIVFVRKKGNRSFPPDIHKINLTLVSLRVSYCLQLQRPLKVSYIGGKPSKNDICSVIKQLVKHKKTAGDDFAFEANILTNSLSMLFHV